MSQDLPVVLHVDDDEDVREIARIALELVGGLKVIQCASGTQALEMAPKAKPDLFLLDVMMPEMSGIETLKRLRDLPDFGQTPALFLTAKVQPEDVEELMETGAAAVIKKPFDPMTVSDEIVRIWRREPARPSMIAI
jgi:CheY-like chemotaxis protein